MLQPGDPGFMQAMINDPTMGAAPSNLTRQMNTPGGRKALGLKAPDEADEEEDTPAPRRRGFTNQGGFATYMHPMQQDFIDKFGPDAQANALQGMIGNTMQAYQDENDSRVAQEREMRRMQHEKEMKQMELDALIARLNAQQ
jgi:hypothetical protein